MYQLFNPVQKDKFEDVELSLESVMELQLHDEAAMDTDDREYADTENVLVALEGRIYSMIDAIENDNGYSPAAMEANMAFVNHLMLQVGADPVELEDIAMESLEDVTTRTETTELALESIKEKAVNVYKAFIKKVQEFLGGALNKLTNSKTGLKMRAMSIAKAAASLEAALKKASDAKSDTKAPAAYIKQMGNACIGSDAKRVGKSDSIDMLAKQAANNMSDLKPLVSACETLIADAVKKVSSKKFTKDDVNKMLTDFAKNNNTLAENFNKSVVGFGKVKYISLTTKDNTVTAEVKVKEASGDAVKEFAHPTVKECQAAMSSIAGGSALKDVAKIESDLAKASKDLMKLVKETEGVADDDNDLKGSAMVVSKFALALSRAMTSVAVTGYLPVALFAVKATKLSLNGFEGDVSKEDAKDSKEDDKDGDDK